MINISRRKEAEAQVEEERFLLRQLIDHIPVQVYFKDLASRFVMANKGMAEWMGLDGSSELIGKHDRDFFDEDHWKPAEADERRIMETGEPITDMLEAGNLDRRRATPGCMTSKFPWRDRHGRIKGTFGVSSDVTAAGQGPAGGHRTGGRSSRRKTRPTKRNSTSPGKSNRRSPARDFPQVAQRPELHRFRLPLHSDLRTRRGFLRSDPAATRTAPAC